MLKYSIRISIDDYVHWLSVDQSIKHNDNSLWLYLSTINNRDKSKHFSFKLELMTTKMYANDNSFENKFKKWELFIKRLDYFVTHHLDEYFLDEHFYSSDFKNKILDIESSIFS